MDAKERETEAGEAEATRRVNPAMRHDAPGEHVAEAEGAREAEEQVHPTQGEPLRPLDPGGIGG